MRLHVGAEVLFARRRLQRAAYGARGHVRRVLAHAHEARPLVDAVVVVC